MKLHKCHFFMFFLQSSPEYEWYSQTGLYHQQTEFWISPHFLLKTKCFPQTENVQVVSFFPGQVPSVLVGYVLFFGIGGYLHVIINLVIIRSCCGWTNPSFLITMTNRHLRWSLRWQWWWWWCYCVPDEILCGSARQGAPLEVPTQQLAASQGGNSHHHLHFHLKLSNISFCHILSAPAFFVLPSSELQILN